MTAIETDGGVADQEPARKKLSGKKIVLFIVLPLLIVVGGGAAVFFSGLLDGLMGGHAEEGEHAEEAAVPAYTGPPVFLPMEEILVNLNTQERRPVFLKLNITLELVRPEDQVAVQGVMPRIVDTFQVYLRELRTDDLRGSAGLYRLREELQMRVGAAAHPVRIKDVLINEFLVQ